MEISMLMLRIQRLGISVYFCWVPEGNERADGIAKKALKFRKEEILSIPFRKGEAKAVIRESVRELWQEVGQQLQSRHENGPGVKKVRRIGAHGGRLPRTSMLAVV